jgi:hypothetical protein
MHMQGVGQSVSSATGRGVKIPIFVRAYSSEQQNDLWLCSDSYGERRKQNEFNENHYSLQQSIQRLWHNDTWHSQVESTIMHTSIIRQNSILRTRRQKRALGIYTHPALKMAT